ncbi:MAG TPA: GNAT family N-acetyltransferase, partial [Terriglobales bacterium]|nr:GNAT family N-acetyltransferase [Terriglobales bacterium]
ERPESGVEYPPGPAMTPRWWTTHAELTAGAARWDAGVEAAGGDNPFVLSTFLRAWAETFAPPADKRGARRSRAGARASQSLRVLALEDSAGAVLAGWPLVRQRRRHGGIACWALRPLGLGFANLNEPFHRMSAPEFAALAERALAERDDWDYISLPLARTPWWEKAGWRWRTRPQGAAARLRLHRPAAEYALGLSPRMQANLRRALRRAAELGGARLQPVTDTRGLEELIAFQLRHNGPRRYPPEREWGAPPEQWEAFVRMLLPRLANAGQLDAMALRLGDRLAAVGFGFRFGSGYKSMLTSFDPAFRTAAPGLLLFYFLMDGCRARGDTWLDMYADAAHLDKRRWQPEEVPLYHGFIFAPSPRGRALFGLSRMRG